MGPKKGRRTKPADIISAEGVNLGATAPKKPKSEGHKKTRKKIQASPSPLASIPRVTVGVSPTDTGEPRTNQAARFAAMCMYTLSDHAMTIDQISALPEFAHVARMTIRNWAREDQWVEKRAETWERWRQQIERDIGTEIVRQKRVMMQGVQSVFNVMLDKLALDPKTKQPKIEMNSYEGVATAFVRITDKLMELQEQVYDTFVPAIESTPGVHADSPKTPRVELTGDQAQRLATLMLRAERAMGQRFIPEAAVVEAALEGEDQPKADSNG